MDKGHGVKFTFMFYYQMLPLVAVSASPDFGGVIFGGEK